MENLLEATEIYKTAPTGNIQKPYDYPTIDVEFITYHHVTQYIIAISHDYPDMYRQNEFITQKMQFFPYRIAFLYLNLATLTIEAIENQLFHALLPIVTSIPDTLLERVAHMSFFEFTAVLDCMASRSWSFEDASQYIDSYSRLRTTKL